MAIKIPGLKASSDLLQEDFQKKSNDPSSYSARIQSLAVLPRAVMETSILLRHYVIALIYSNDMEGMLRLQVSRLQTSISKFYASTCCRGMKIINPPLKL